MKDLLFGRLNLEDVVAGERLTDDYANHVYALTMGTGKTVLMTVFMYYDTVVSYYHPDDQRFAKNFVVFAPDTTIITSLKEIKSLDPALVIPSQYQNALLQIKFHYLEDTKTKLSIPDGSNYNIIVTNSQKIIVRRHTPSQKLQKRLFGDETAKEADGIENARFATLKSLDRLAIFIDEAHHSFGKTLQGELKRLKDTINRIHREQPIVGVINMTGTPYIDGQLLPEVVFYYGLKAGIEDGILKQAEVIEYGKVKDRDYLFNVVNDFRLTYREELVEGKLPKIAIYTKSIAELKEVRQMLERDIFRKLRIPATKIVENHSEAQKSELIEFTALDTAASRKQFVLLVNKGTEGWNCRSLFATALYRQPPQIFTLQATTRCLRAIGDNSKRAKIFLSSEQYKFLDRELKLNFDIDIATLTRTASDTSVIECRIEKRKTITVKKRIRTITAVRTRNAASLVIDFSKYTASDAYKATRELKVDQGAAVYTEAKLQKLGVPTHQPLSYYEILGRIHTTTHIGFADIKSLFVNAGLTQHELISQLSADNGKLDFLIEQIIKSYYEYEIHETDVIEELKIVKLDGDTFHFQIAKDRVDDGLVVYREDPRKNRLGFHLNPYRFDSRDERELFAHLRSVLADNERIEDIYFTGATDHASQTDFHFAYEHEMEDGLKVRSYFPDLLVEITTATGVTKYLVIEIKGGDKRADYQAAKKAHKSGQPVTNEMLAKEIGFNAFKDLNKQFEYRIVFDALLPSRQLETSTYVANTTQSSSQ